MTLYNFDKCDIIVASSSFFILGKGMNGMIYNYATPLEIVFSGEVMSTNLAHLNEVLKVSEEFILFTIDDYNYKNPLNIKIQSSEALISWFIQHKS